MGHFFVFKDTQTFCEFPSLLIVTERVILWSGPEDTLCNFSGFWETVNSSEQNAF